MSWICLIFIAKFPILLTITWEHKNSSILWLIHIFIFCRYETWYPFECHPHADCCWWVLFMALQTQYVVVRYTTTLHTACQIKTIKLGQTLNWWKIPHIDGLVQERRHSSALAMELRLSCTNSSIYHPYGIYRVFVSSSPKCSYSRWECWCQKQLIRSWINNYIPENSVGCIIHPCPRYPGLD